MCRIGGMVLTVTGFLACHWIITLPLLISLLAGTALGSFLSHNTGLVYAGAGIYARDGFGTGGLAPVQPTTTKRPGARCSSSPLIPADATTPEQRR